MLLEVGLGPGQDLGRKLTSGPSMGCGTALGGSAGPVGYLDGQTSESMRTGYFRGNLVGVSPRFSRWARGPGIV